jgi:hypothetical protein
MATANFGGRPVQYLTHEPFSYFVRIENTAANPVGVTVRIFLAPAEQAADRRSWMEMDKFLVELPGGEKLVVHRPDTESSIVKRPRETSPATVTEGGNGPDENSYCDCGWPYTLLLPRGKAEGMPFRLLVFCTDASIDRVRRPSGTLRLDELLRRSRPLPRYPRYGLPILAPVRRTRGDRDPEQDRRARQCRRKDCDDPAHLRSRQLRAIVSGWRKALGASDGRGAIFGSAQPDVGRVAFELADGRTVSARTASNDALGTDVRFFIVREALPAIEGSRSI